MALLRSLLTGVSGLRAQQTAIDVTGDNIANVSTVGFKGSRANFSTMISQNLKFGQAPSGFLGGTNPSQVGLGVQVAEIQKLMTQGQLRQTGLATDLAIDDGQNARTFFVLKDYTGNNVYSRDGTFGLNRENFLFDPGSGYVVQGWMADTNTQVVGPNGAIDFSLNTGGQIENIQIELGNLVIAKETTYTDWRGNLNGGGEIADQASVLESEAL
ncbi:MAG: flagellar hook-basal body complex protein, partial [Planctomycetes bacterium]|nr:flagellar hook-basal body complex protein [Planctomycetota bacterium]